MIQSPLKLRQPFLSKNILFFTALLAFLFVFIYSAPELLAQEAADEEVKTQTMLDNVLDISARYGRRGRSRVLSVLRSPRTCSPQCLCSQCLRIKNTLIIISHYGRHVFELCHYFIILCCEVCIMSLYAYQSVGSGRSGASKCCRFS